MDAARREWLARQLLAPLIVMVLLAAVVCPWHTPSCVDNRTYLEMIQGVARHGVPVVDNGPAEQFPALRNRWDQIGGGGRLWGSYPPLYAYFAAPLFMVGGPRLVTQANVALLALVALGVYSLGKRLTRDPLVGTAAAWLTLCGTHVWTFSFDVSAYSVMIALVVWTAVFAAAAADTDEPRNARLRSTGLAGLLGAAAMGTHLLSAPLISVVLASVLVSCERGLTTSGSRSRWRLSQDSVLRGVVAAVGMATVLVPVSLLNHHRFGTWSPLGSGRCVWAQCQGSHLGQQGLGAMVTYNLPLLAWAAALTIALVAVRRSVVGVAFVLSAGACALVPASQLHTAAFHALTLFTAFVFDLSRFDLGFWKPTDGLGVFLGPHPIKSLLQCSPVLSVAVLAQFAASRDRRIAWVIATAPLALVASLVLRGEISLVLALGYPYLDLRYLTPALPMLAVFAIVALRELRWRTWHAPVLVILTVAAVAAGASAQDDLAFARRWVLLRGTLGVSAFALVAVATLRTWDRGLTRAVAAVATLAALSMSIGVCIGVDLHVWIHERQGHDRDLSMIAEATPHRFGLIGLAGAPGIDGASALRTDRDIEYADIDEVGGRFENFRGLIDHWDAERRPVFAIMPAGFVSPWPDHFALSVDRRVRLYLVRHR